MDFELREACSVMLRIVATNKLQAGVKRLIAHCEKASGERAIAKRLSKLPYLKDAQGIAAQIAELAKNQKFPKDTQGFYVGLDGLNMPDGHGLQFGCSPIADESESANWAEECNTYPGDLLSPVLSEIYRQIDGAGIWDYALAQGYCGLAIRAAFESIPAKTLLGGQKVRHVCWGFHDGDLQYLGTLSSRGFQTFTPPEPEKVQSLKPVKRTFPRGSGAIKWVQRAEQIALENPKAVERGEQLLSLADLYATLDAWDAVNRVLRDVDALRQIGVNISDARIKHESDIIQKFVRSRDTRKIPDIIWFFGAENVPIWDDRPQDPVDKLNLLERLTAIVQKGDKKILRRDIPRLAREYSALVKKHGDSTSDYAIKKQLMIAYIALKNISKANELVEDDEVLYYEYVNTCFKSDLPADFLKQLEDQELESSFSNLPNLHHAASSCGRLAKLHAEAGATERYVSIVKRALAHIPKAMKVCYQPWQVASVFCELAPAAHIANDVEGVKYFTAQAEHWAEIQTKSKGSRDDVSMVWSTVSDMYAGLGDFEKAIVAAKRIPQRERSREKIMKYHAQLDRDEEIDALLSKCKTANSKVELLETIARSLIP